MTQDLFPSYDPSGFSDVDVEWINARFEQDISGDKPNVRLVVTQLDEDGHTRENTWLSAGSSLRVVGGGAAVEHPDPRRNSPMAGFAQRTKLEQLLVTLVEVGGVDAFKEKTDAGIGPRQADFWEGISFHLVNETREFGVGTNKQTYSQPVATAFYGWDGIPGGRKEAPVKVEGEAMAALKGLAAGYDTYEKFVMAAYSSDVINEPGVQRCVDDVKWYESARG